jgi:hypothetical protein
MEEVPPAAAAAGAVRRDRAPVHGERAGRPRARRGHEPETGMGVYCPCCMIPRLQWRGR